MPLDFTELKALFSAQAFGGEETLGLYQVPSFNLDTIPMLWIGGKGRTEVVAVDSGKGVGCSGNQGQET